MAVMPRARQFARDLTARAIAALRYFELWQSPRFHATLVHYYESIPDTPGLPFRFWNLFRETADFV